MARIFISHSSKDNAAALAIAGWLREAGWDDLFLDLDPDRGISAGERWQRALHEAANRCEAVLFLVSGAWLASRWCLAELHLAEKLNKRLFGVLIEELPLDALPTPLIESWQLVNLARGSDHQLFHAAMPDGTEGHVTFSRGGLQSLKNGLMKAGLDPRFFAWPPVNDPDRPPYRGLRPLDIDDAGIYFGREAQIIMGLDRLRGLAERPGPRLLAIIGASGAGKSSFLRAGLLARLQRDDRHFLALPPLRPERAAISGETGLLRVLEQGLQAGGVPTSRAKLKQALAKGAEGLAPVLTALAHKARPPALEGVTPPPPRLVLAIDQTEELFQGEAGSEADQLLGLIRALALGASPEICFVFTIRSDGFERLQSSPALAELPLETLSLPPMPRGAYQQVIEGPARRMEQGGRRLRLDPMLTEQLLTDIEAGGGKDALPLLAFTLERLFLEYGGDGDLTREEYRAIGGIEGSIEAAVERALDTSDPALPRDRPTLLALLRRALIPWLAGIDPQTGAPRRRVARLAEIPAESQALVRHLIDQRLLATDLSPETGEVTIEPAHEALLRQWGLLHGWLKEDFAALSALEGLQRATRDWLANGRDAAWLSHAAGRLEDAERVAERADFAAILGRSELSYLAACRTAEAARRDAELQAAQALAAEKSKVARRTRLGLIAAGLLAVLATGAAVFAAHKAEDAERQATLAELGEAAAFAARNDADEARSRAIENETTTLAALARAALNDGDTVKAMKLALAAWPRPGEEERPQLKRTLEVLADAFAAPDKQLWSLPSSPVNAPLYLADGSQVLLNRPGWLAGSLQRVALATGAILERYEDCLTATTSSDGAHLLLFCSEQISRPRESLAASLRLPDRKETVRILAAGSGETVAVLQHPRSHELGDVTADGAWALTSGSGSELLLWSLKERVLAARLDAPPGDKVEARFSPGGQEILSSASDPTAATRYRLWSLADVTRLPLLLASLLGHHQVLADYTALPDYESYALFSPNGHRLAIQTAPKAPGLGPAILLDTASGDVLARRTQSGEDFPTRFLPDGRLVWHNEERGPWLEGLQGERRTLEGLDQLLDSIAISPDGRLVAIGGGSGGLWVWETQEARLQARPAEGGAAFGWLSFTPDGTHLIGLRAERVEIWAAETGRLMGTIGGPELRSLKALRIAPDGQRLLTITESGGTSLWALPDGERLGHWQSVSEATGFAPSGELFLHSWRDGEPGVARLLAIRPKARIASILETAADSVYSFSLSDDGSRLIIYGDSSTVWDTDSGNRLLEIPSGAPFFSPDGELIAVDTTDGVELWRASDGSRFLRLPEEASAPLAFAPDGRLLVASGQDDTIQLWSSATGEKVQEIELWSDYPWLVQFSDAGDTLLVAGSARVLLWSVDRAEALWEFTLPGNDLSLAALSADGSRLLTMSGEGIRFWDMPSGEILAERQGDEISDAAFSPDGSLVLLKGRDELSVWDAASGRSLISRRGSLLESSPDFRFLVDLSGNNPEIWDTMTGARLYSLDESIGEVIFSPDGTHLIGGPIDGMFDFAAYDSEANISSYRSQDGSHILQWSTSRALSAGRFTGDGKRVALIEGDELVLRDGLVGFGLARVPLPQDASVRDMQFSRDGTRILLQLWDERLIVVESTAVVEGEGLELACRWLHTNLSLDELAAEQGIAGLSPICGAQPPMPVDLEVLR